MKSDLIKIPGIGKTFVKDLGRIGIQSIADLKGKSPESLFKQLQKANEAENHSTSKNYLYVLRMAVFFANNGGADPERLKWSDWKDQ